MCSLNSGATTSFLKVYLISTHSHHSMNSPCISIIISGWNNRLISGCRVQSLWLGVAGWLVVIPSASLEDTNLKTHRYNNSFSYIVKSVKSRLLWLPDKWLCHRIKKGNGKIILKWMWTTLRVQVVPFSLSRRQSWSPWRRRCLVGRADCAGARVGPAPAADAGGPEPPGWSWSYRATNRGPFGLRMESLLRPPGTVQTCIN